MDDDPQISQFEAQIENVIHRFRHEYNLPYAALIGVLTLKATELSNEALAARDEKE